MDKWKVVNTLPGVDLEKETGIRKGDNIRLKVEPGVYWRCYLTKSPFIITNGRKTKIVIEVLGKVYDVKNVNTPEPSFEEILNSPLPGETKEEHETQVRLVQLKLLERKQQKQKRKNKC